MFREGRPVDFRYAPFATEDAWRRNMSRRARSRHQKAAENDDMPRKPLFLNGVWCEPHSES
jgi:hypothetical protein